MQSHSAAMWSFCCNHCAPSSLQQFKFYAFKNSMMQKETFVTKPPSGAPFEQPLSLRFPGLSAIRAFPSASCIKPSRKQFMVVSGLQGGEVQSDFAIPTMSEIAAIAQRRKVSLEIKQVGPWFTIIARESGEEGQESMLGKAEGFTRPWIDGTILHLDSIRMAKIDSAEMRSVFGVALFIGAAAFRLGYDKNCTRAELLAINDTDEYHEKLVRYYGRLGFKAVHEVEGGSLEDLAHMLVWGGVGTRMNADIVELLKRWSKVLKASKEE